MYRRLSDEHGLAYAFQASTRAYSDAGCWFFLCGTNSIKGPAVVELLRTELTQLAQQDPATAADLEAAIRHARAGLLQKAENSVSSAIAMASRYCVDGSIRGPEAEAARLARVTATDVARAAAVVADGLFLVVQPDVRGPR
jgi:predicted Zn-dependent peptidase